MAGSSGKMLAGSSGKMLAGSSEKMPIGSSEEMASSSGEMPAGSSEEKQGENCECLSLPQAISLGDLQGILNRRQVATTAWIDAFETPLQKACICRQLEIVKQQLQDMTRPNESVSLALDIAAGNGNLKVVIDLCKNEDNLPFLEVSAPNGAIPVVRASNAGHRKVTRYLFDLTPLGVLMKDGGKWATCLLLDAIFYGFLDIALELFDKVRSDPAWSAQVPYLAVTKHRDQRSSPLRFLALKPDLFRSHCDLGFWQHLVYSCISYLDFPTDSATSKLNQYQRLFWMTLKGLLKWLGINQLYEAHNLLQKICKAAKELPDIVKDKSWKEMVYKALLEAVENGNKEFFMEIIKCNPELLWISEAVSGRNFFQLAVEFRKETIFNLIYGLDDRKVILLRSCDKNNNNILHIAAHLSPPHHLSKISGSALKVQRDTQWFWEVTSLVSEREVVQKNSDNMTPRQVFEASHEPLRKEGEEWMKYTATACSLVAALIATVTFQAIFTVPGGTDETLGTPLLLRDAHFTAFIMADTLAFFASCISVLIFLSILTARYSFDDFIVSLPRKMILGLTILFISIASMLVAFITALSSSMSQRPMLVVPLKPLASVPAVLFVMLQYPLLKEMISSTYGKGIFRRNTKSWL